MVSIGNDWRERRAVLLAVVCALIGLCPGEALAAGEDANICGKTTSAALGGVPARGPRRRPSRNRDLLELE